MPYFAPAAMQRSQSARPVARRHLDLVAELAREADPEDPRRHARTSALAHAHVREGLGVEVDARGQLGDQLAASRAAQADRRPLLGDRGAVDLELRPFGLQPLLEPGEHARSTARGRAHQVVVLAEPRGDAVVEHHAVLAQHQAVAAAADRELAPGVGVDAVEQLGRVAAPGGRSCRASRRRECRCWSARPRPRARPRRPCPRPARG